MNREKISVICIIYRVEPYLRQCLDSILAQTYRELEIILVVGTSQKEDGSLAIAKEYAEKDGRIRLVITPAKGTGDARNNGLQAVTGDLIGFVDGDDYIEPDMFEHLAENLRKHEADIAVCGKYSEYEDAAPSKAGQENPGTLRSVPDVQRPLREMEKKDAFEMILRNDGFFFHCWDKLFRAELFSGMSFPTDRYLEDRYVIGNVIGRAEKIVYDTKPLYHYRVRSDSLSRVYTMSEYTAHADTEFCDYVKEVTPELANLADSTLMYDHITCIQNYLLYFKGTERDTEEMREKRKGHLSYIREHLFVKNPELSFKVRFKGFLALYAGWLLKALTNQNQLMHEQE